MQPYANQMDIGKELQYRHKFLQRGKKKQKKDGKKEKKRKKKKKKR